MKKEMLINVLQPEECRIAILEDGVLEELYVERTSHESYVGNIYKGRIVNIEPSIQAAFVDFGVGRNGFLHVSDVEPAYYRHLEERRGDRDRGRRGNGRDRDRGRGRDRDYRDRDRPEPRRPQPQVFEEAWEIEEVEIAPASNLASAELPPPADVDAATDEFSFSSAPPASESEMPVSRPAEDVSEPGEETGLTLEEPSNEPESPQAVETPEAESEVEAERPARGKSRRRGKGEGSRGRRGGSRGRRGKPAPDAPPESGASETEPATPPDDQPRPMDSAERRTEEEDDGGSSGINDEDLFFPRPQTSAPPPPPEEPEPVEAQEEPVEAYTERKTFDEISYAEIEPPAEPEAPAPEVQAPVDEPDAEEFVEETLPTQFDEEFEDVPPPPRRPREERRGRDDRRDDRRGGGRDRDRRPGGRDRGRGMGRPGMGRPKPLIQDIFKRGQEVLVQVIKEGIGTKGPTLSTYISIAGRYLVLMPGLNRVGVSRKIADDEQRRRLREIFHELQPPRGLGFIIRTAGIDKNKKELQNDLAYLSRLWQVVVQRIRKMKAPAEIYQESDMITRTIRDTFTSDVDNIVVDEPNAYEHAKEFLEFVMPRYANRIQLYAEPEPLFHKRGIEDEIVRIQQRHVPLPNGGSIVIDQTEALVAIDVNSGNFRADNNAEETAYQMNLLAAKEISRQLRLRDLGGVIVNDFIDMRDDKHRRNVERAMRDAVKRDRARTKILRISQFGLIEMTRQRIRPSLKRSVYHDCPHCRGSGQVKTVESMSIEVMRLLQLAAHRTNVRTVQIRVADTVANYLHNKKRREVSGLEEAGEIQVQITGVPAGAPESLEFVCYDNNNNEVKFLPHLEEPQHRSRRR
jgi:ribonuclease E